MAAGKISLPTLIQRVRVDTTSMKAAEKRADVFADKFEANADRVDTSAAGMSRSIDGLNDSLDDYTRSARDAGRASDDLGKDIKNARDDLDKVGESADDAADGIKRVGDEADDAEPKVGKFRQETDKSNNSLTGFAKQLGNAGGGLKGLIKILIGLKLLKMGASFAVLGTAIAGLVGVIGQLVPIAAAAGAALVAVTGAVAPLLGVVGALPGALFALGGAFGVFKLATGSANEAAAAIKKYGENSEEAKEALRGLTPEGRAYAKQLGATSKQISVLSKLAQKFTLPGLTKALKIITPLFNGPFRSIIKDIGTAVGDIAVGFAKFAVTRDFRLALRDVGKISADLLRTLAPLLPSIATAFVKIVKAAAPMTEVLGQFLTRSLDWFNVMDDDKLTKFFNNAGKVFLETWSILGDFGRGLGNWISAATEGFGGQDGLLNSMGDAGKKFLELTKSTKGRNDMVKYFEDVRPTAESLGRFFGELWRALVRISTDPNTPKLIDSLTQDLLPTIEEIIKDVSEGLPGILDLVNSVVGIFDGIPWSGIGAVAGFVGDVIEKVDELISQMPLLGGALAAAFSVWTIVKWKRRFDALSPAMKQLLTGRNYTKNLPTPTVPNGVDVGDAVGQQVYWIRPMPVYIVGKPTDTTPTPVGTPGGNPKGNPPKTSRWEKFKTKAGSGKGKAVIVTAVVAAAALAADAAYDAGKNRGGPLPDVDRTDPKAVAAYNKKMARRREDPKRAAILEGRERRAEARAKAKKAKADAADPEKKREAILAGRERRRKAAEAKKREKELAAIGAPKPVGPIGDPAGGAWGWEEWILGAPGVTQNGVGNLGGAGGATGDAATGVTALLGSLTAARDNAPGIMDSIRNAITGGVDRTNTDAAAAAAGLGPSITGPMGSVPSTLPGPLGAITGPIAAAFNALRGNVDTANAGIPASVQARGVEAGTEAGLIPGLIRGAFGEPTAMLFDIGVGIVQGLINGIRSLAGSVTGVIGGIVSGAINAARNALGLNESQTPTYADSDFARPGSGTALLVGGSVPVSAPPSSERMDRTSSTTTSSVTQNNTYSITSRAMNERSLVRELRDIEARPLLGRTP